MAHAELVGLGVDRELRAPPVRDPACGVRVAQEGRDRLAVPPGHDQVVARRRGLEGPVPGVPPGHPGAGLVRADHRSGPDRRPDRVVGRPRSLGQPPEGLVDPALADGEADDVATDRHQSLVADVVALVAVPQERRELRPERPGRLPPSRIGALGPGPTAPAPGRGLPGLDDHRPHGRQFHDLAPPDPALPGLGERPAAALTGGRPTPHDPSRHLSTPTLPRMPPPRPSPAPSFGPVRLEPDRRRHRRVLRRLRRRLASHRLRLASDDPSFALRDPPRQPADRRDHLAEPHHQLNQFRSTQLLQRRRSIASLA